MQWSLMVVTFGLSCHFKCLGGGGQGNTGHERVVKGRGGKRACRLYLRSATGYKYLSHTPEGLCPLETVWQEHLAPAEGKSVDTVLKPAQTTWLYKSLSENYTKLFTTPLVWETSSCTHVVSFSGYVHAPDHFQYTNTLGEGGLERSSCAVQQQMCHETIFGPFTTNVVGLNEQSYVNREKGYLLPTCVWKITCRHFDWILQTSCLSIYAAANWEAAER